MLFNLFSQIETPKIIIFCFKSVLSEVNESKMKDDPQESFASSKFYLTLEFKNGKLTGVSFRLGYLEGPVLKLHPRISLIYLRISLKIPGWGPTGRNIITSRSTCIKAILLALQQNISA